ncbi:MAG: recombinase family protein [Candidatus Woesearchaeota archaeon]
MRRAALYVRVSTEEQAKEGFSINSQVMDLTEYATKNNMAVTKIFKDEGISGSKFESRPGLQEMLDEAEKKGFDVLLIYSYSRLGRDNYETEGIVRRLMKLGIEVISLKEQYGQDPVGVLIRQIIGAVNEFERKQIVERLKDVMNNKAKSGYTQNRPPLGYKIINKETVVDEEKKQIVIDIFKMRAEGKSLREISKIVGISHVGIKKMLKNKFYLGFVMFNNTYYKGKHPAIIDEELFNAANSKG